MAVWQYRLTVIPKKALLDKYTELPEKLFIDHEGWNEYWDNPSGKIDDDSTVNWWQDQKVCIEDIRNKVDSLLPRASWNDSKDCLIWKMEQKKEDIDCSIFFNRRTKELESFDFRIDVRNSNTSIKFLKMILELCIERGFILMNTDGALIEPQKEKVFEDIKKSNAFKFVSDPKTFFKEIEKTKN